MNMTTAAAIAAADETARELTARADWADHLGAPGAPKWRAEAAKARARAEALRRARA